MGIAAICVSGQGTHLVIRIGITVDKTLKRHVEMALFFWTCLPHKPQLTPPSCFEDHEKISPLPAECAVSARRMRSLAVGEGDGEGEGEGDGETDRDHEPLTLALALWGEGEGDGDGEGNVLGAVSSPSESPVARFPVARSSLVQTCR